MWRLHRYYLKELAINFAIAFVVMFAIVLVSLVTKGIQRSGGGGPWEAFLITVFFAVDTFSHLVTIAFLVGTVLTYARAGQDRELIALRAAGLSPRVAMMPALLVGIALTVLASFANHYVIPDVHYKKYRVVAEVTRNIFENLKLGTDRITVPGTDYVATLGQQEPGSWGRDCTIYCPPGRRFGHDLPPIFHVDRIRTQTDDSSYTLVLEGVRDPMKGMPLGNLLFHVSSEDLAGGGRPDRDDDMRSDQLLSEVARGVHFKPNEAIYTLFRRCCFSLMPVLLAPIGFCLAEMMRNRGRVLAIVIALVPLVLFYIGDFVGARIVRSSGSPWGAWAPALALVVFGLPVCWRQLRR